MEIIGAVEKTLDKSNSNFKKRIVIISDAMDKRNRWGIECRGKLAEAIKTLRHGDCIKVSFYNDFQTDPYDNHYNNLIAEKVERL